MEDYKTEYLVCNCSTFNHIMSVSKFKDEEDLYINFNLTHLPFWKRVVLGIKYIFGYKSRYGDFTELITTREKLENIINKLYE